MAKQKISKRKRRSQIPPLKSPPKLPDSVLAVLDQQHGRLFQAIGIVSCARYASESKIVGEPDISGGLEAALEIMGDVAEAIEELVPLKYFHDKLDEADES